MNRHVPDSVDRFVVSNYRPVAREDPEWAAGLVLLLGLVVFVGLMFVLAAMA